MMPKTPFAIQVIRSRYEGMISMFCSQCGAPMGDNDKFCGVCGTLIPRLRPPVPLRKLNLSRRVSRLPSRSRSLRPSRL